MDGERKNKFNLFFVFLLIIGILIFAAAIIFLIIKDRNSPQRQLNSAIQQYNSLDLQKIDPVYVDTLYGVHKFIIDKTTIVEKDLKSGNLKKAKDELIALQKRIRRFSTGDNFKKLNLDHNENGVLDHLEPFYSSITKVINNL